MGSFDDSPFSSGFFIVAIAIAFALGYLLFRLIKPKSKPENTREYGRQVLGFAMLTSTTALLPSFIINPVIDNFLFWLIPSIVFGFIAYVIGLIYGKSKSPTIEIAKEVASSFKGSSDGAESTINSNDNNMPLVRKLLIIAAAMLMIATLPLPIEFYTLLRIVVCVAAAYSAYCFFDKKIPQSGLILVLIAIVWNPLIPIYLYDKFIWILLDISAAIYMFLLSRKT
tara:strand:+ start:124 stop:801 length:678 start_codon:yes stop_codon:yes gene_type:complete